MPALPAGMVRPLECMVAKGPDHTRVVGGKSGSVLWGKRSGPEGVMLSAFVEGRARREHTLGRRVGPTPDVDGSKGAGPYQTWDKVGGVS
jgi:hypothetical protein